MTIADRIREETAFDFIKGLVEKGLEAEFIADAFKMPVKKVQLIIQKIKEPNS
jgi:hypothetical protein